MPTARATSRSIVKRSGKSTDEGIRFGRSEMSYFLGIAYLEGTTAPRTPTQAVRWLQRAATLGNRGAGPPGRRHRALTALLSR